MVGLEGEIVRVVGIEGAGYAFLEGEDGLV